MRRVQLAQPASQELSHPPVAIAQHQRDHAHPWCTAEQPTRLAEATLSMNLRDTESPAAHMASLKEHEEEMDTKMPTGTRRRPTEMEAVTGRRKLPEKDTLTAKPAQHLQQHSMAAPCEWA